MWHKEYTTIGVLILIGIIGASATRFNKSESIIWQDTNYKVDTGLIFNIIQYHVRNPCEIFDGDLTNDMEDNENSKWTNQSIARFSQLCNEDFDNVWTPKFEAFAKCRDNHGIARQKRNIWFAVGGVYIVQVLTSVVATTVIVEKQISGLKEGISDAKATAKQAIEAFKTQSDINNKTVAAVNEVSLKTSNMMVGMDMYSSKLPEAVWTGMKVYDSLKTSADLFDELEYDCSHHRQINTVALSKLTGHQSLRDIEKRDTHGVTVERSGPNEIFIQFLSPGTSNDTSIHQVGHFLRPVNLTTNPAILRYAGPEFLIHNSTANCTRGIEEPKRERVSISCTQVNYSDPMLALWVLTNLTIDDLEPAIISKGDKAHIMCLSNEITVNNITTPCPAWPFHLPVDVSFRAGNLFHEARIVRTNGTKTVTPNKFIHFNDSLQEEELKEQISFIRTIQHLNEELRDMIKEKEGSLSFKLSDLKLSDIGLGEFSWLSIAKWLPGAPFVFGFLYWVMSRSSNNRENVTVINTPAPRDPTPVPESAPLYPLYPIVRGVRFGSTTTIG